VFREFLADPTPRVLWNMQQCSLSPFGREELRSVVSRLMRLDHRKRPGGRSAFVCARDHDQNVMRVLIAYAEANDYAIELAVFRELEEAQEWLAQHPGSDWVG
jgi:hypothetical protein